MLDAARQRAVAWCDAHLVPEWRKAYRFISVRAAMVQAGVLLTWGTMPDDMKQSLGWVLPAIAMFVLVVGVVGSATNQKKLKDDGDATAPRTGPSK